MFEEMFGETVALLKSKLHIPEAYAIFFTSSATECWEIIAQSLVERQTTHIYNGAFGEKWWQYTQKIKPLALGISFDENEEIPYDHISPNTEIICLTQNETSNGTQVSNAKIKAIKEKYPQMLLAVDATSSMAGINLDINQADLWFASVQKCFGLPAGLGVMICSPRAVEKGLAIQENLHYNSFPFIIGMTAKNQTAYTPNVLGIYLLNRVLQMVPDIKEVDIKIKDRYRRYIHFFEESTQLDLHIHEPATRSHTVLVLEGEQDQITTLKKEAKKVGIQLGNGYGKYAHITLRIANFPAIGDRDVDKLLQFFSGKR